MVTRGAGSMGKAMDEVQFSAEELAVAVSEAHRLRRTVSAHAIGIQGVRAALTAGVDSIEHGLLIDTETVQLMRETGASFCPTMELYRRIEAMVAAGDFPVIPKLSEAIADHARTVRTAHEIGVPILAGTDAGGLIGFGGIAREVERIAQSGVPSAVAIGAATETAARCLGAPNLGRIEPGCVADLVVVRGNPVENPKCLSEVEIVIKDGRLVFKKGDVKCPGPQ
ncbi:MAG TPA: amidohydrolase family protein, partial [Galbitalea sp.]